MYVESINAICDTLYTHQTKIWGHKLPLWSIKWTDFFFWMTQVVEILYISLLHFSSHIYILPLPLKRNNEVQPNGSSYFEVVSIHFVLFQQFFHMFVFPFQCSLNKQSLWNSIYKRIKSETWIVREIYVKYLWCPWQHLRNFSIKNVPIPTFFGCIPNTYSLKAFVYFTERLEPNTK